MDYKHIFISCMNNSGSSLLYKILGNCSNVVKLEYEGQHYTKNLMPSPKAGNKELKRFAIEFEEKYTNENNYNWPEIKKIWYNQWLNDPKYKNHPDKYNVFLLEKTPSNFLKCNMLEREFNNPYFVIMLRSPYAVCEGVMRTTNKALNGYYTPEKAIKNWLIQADYQIKNINTLKNNVWFTYEDLCDDFNKVKEKLLNFVPLQNLNVCGKYRVGKYNQEVNNLNDQQIARLSKETIDIINKELYKRRDVMEFFEYDYIELN